MTTRTASMTMKPLAAILLAGACAHPGVRHIHSLPSAEYALPCVIEGVKIVVVSGLDEANAACSPPGAPGRADDGTPIDGVRVKSGGCFWPRVIIEGNSLRVTGTMIVQRDREVVADEMEHLIYNACRKFNEEAAQ